MLLKMVRKKLPHISHINDGAISQYENLKSIINQHYHEKNHILKAEHHFFATSHDKSACDGIGGMIK